MFENLTDSAQRLWLIALLILWAILLFGGCAFGKPDAQRARRMPAWTRIGSSLTLVVAAWSWVGFTTNSTTTPFVLLIAVGMTLGFIGDLFMARLPPLVKLLKEPTIGGIASFGLGHIAYIAALLTYGGRVGLDAIDTRLIAWGAWLLIGAVGWYLIVFRGHQPTRLHWLALPYALLLASTAGVATGLGLQIALFLPIAVGAALFLLSDLILAARLFNNAFFPLIDDVVWLTYGPAQMLIVYGAGRLLQQ